MSGLKLAGVAAIAFLVVGCSSSPEVEMATPKSVIIKNVDSKQDTEALQAAELECQKHGLNAVILNYDKSDSTATYECK
jgi:uncharacterized protein YcfL